MDIIVFQNGPALSGGVVDTLHRLIEGEDADNVVWLPLEQAPPVQPGRARWAQLAV